MPFKTSIIENNVAIPTCGRVILGSLSLPPVATGIVLFAHGMGSGRFSPLNRNIARHLNQAGFATLLLDLISPDEELTASSDTPFSEVDAPASRLVQATHWLRENNPHIYLPAGYFGSDWGAAAALIAAASPNNNVKAIVSWIGRLDLADAALSHVQAPTLLMIGSEHSIITDLNRTALPRLASSDKKCVTVEGSPQVFEEIEKRDEIAYLAVEWFKLHLSVQQTPANSFK